MSWPNLPHILEDQATGPRIDRQWPWESGRDVKVGDTSLGGVRAECFLPVELALARFQLAAGPEIP